MGPACRGAFALPNRDAVRRPVGDRGGPDEARALHGPPVARVAGGPAIVAHDEVLARLELRPPAGAVVTPLRGYVLVGQALAVDEHGAVALGHLLAGKRDHALDEGERAGLAAARCAGWSVEDRDLAAARAAKAVDDPERDDSVGVVGQAAAARPGAVQRGLHRRRRDAVWLRHLGLEDEHERDCDGDRQNPVEHPPPGPGQAAEETVGDHPSRVLAGAGDKVAILPAPHFTGLAKWARGAHFL